MEQKIEPSAYHHPDMIDLSNFSTIEFKCRSVSTLMLTSFAVVSMLRGIFESQRKGVHEHSNLSKPVKVNIN